MDSRIALLGIVGAGLTALPPAAHAGAEEDAFAKAGYTVCDARLIGISWNDNDIPGMVRMAGQKIINGYENQVKDIIADGRTRNNGNLVTCPPEDIYSASDIAAFAAYWDVGRSEGRKMMSEKLLGGEKSSVDDAITEQAKKS